MKTMGWMLKVAVELVFFLLVANAVILVTTWLFGLPPMRVFTPWSIRWLTLMTALALQLFIWLLPLTALMMLVGLLVDNEHPSTTETQPHETP